jgi:hypothetical protein
MKIVWSVGMDSWLFPPDVPGPYATLYWPGGKGPQALAFDDCVPEVFCFHGSWCEAIEGSIVEFDLTWRPAVENLGAFAWQAAIKDASGINGHSAIAASPGGDCRRFHRTTLGVQCQRPILYEDNFTLIIYRPCHESADTGVGDSLLYVVEADFSSKPAGKGISDVISDDEYARRAGIYRGPK